MLSMSNAAAAHYADSPACKLVATHCACCGKPLLDAVSVEYGIGPDCRARHGYALADAFASWEAHDAALAGTPALAVIAESKCHPRLAANYLVWCIALEPEGEHAAAHVRALDALGFRRLAARIAKRLGAVSVVDDGEAYVVKAPYSEPFLAALFRHGVRSTFDREAKERRVERASRVGLWRALRAAYAGRMLVTAKGIATL